MTKKITWLVPGVVPFVEIFLPGVIPLDVFVELIYLFSIGFLAADPVFVLSIIEVVWSDPLKIPASNLFKMRVGQTWSEGPSK